MDFIQFAPTLKKLILLFLFFVMVGQAVRLFDNTIYETKISKSITEDDSQDEKDTKEDKNDNSEVSMCCYYSIFETYYIVGNISLHAIYQSLFYLSPFINRQGPPPDVFV